MARLAALKSKVGPAAKAVAGTAASFARAAGNILSIPDRLSSLAVLILSAVIVFPGPHWIEVILAVVIFLIALKKLVKG